MRRGALIVIPIGRALLYAEPIYLQAERSPMPELRIVVLATQERLAYGPTFEAALAALFGQAPSTLSPSAATSSGVATPAPAERPTATPSQPAPSAPSGDVNALIAEAARAISPTTSGSPRKASWATPARNSKHLKRVLEQLAGSRR